MALRKTRVRCGPFRRGREQPMSSVFFDDGKMSGSIGWAVKWKGEVLAPRFMSARAAQGHLNSKHDELLGKGAP